MVFVLMVEGEKKMWLIDRDWLLDKLSGDDPANMEDYYYNAIKDAPTIDAEPVRHGEWKESISLDDCFWVCSVCSFPSEATAAPTLYKFCPNCGAKMRGKTDE